MLPGYKDGRGFAVTSYPTTRAKRALDSKARMASSCVPSQTGSVRSARSGKTRAASAYAQSDTAQNAALISNADTKKVSTAAATRRRAASGLIFTRYPPCLWLVCRICIRPNTLSERNR